ncbi:MAG TPA: HAMP domain-containing sensor histidine kinase [Gemmatimonadaceae bacterium]|nr:HAMP domain-containing sensor histidine kinase [Gemmatimonadaceae bacterium]
MAPTPRGRLAIAIAGLLLLVVVVFALIVRQIEAARSVTEYQQQHELEVRSRTTSLALRLLESHNLGDRLTLKIGNDVPAATSLLENIVDGAGGYVWVLDNGGFTIYNSRTVRELADSVRIELDSVVRTIPPGVGVKGVRGNESAERIGDAHVTPLPLRGATLTLFSGSLGLPQSVYRVVVGRFFSPPPPRETNMTMPILVIIPLIVLASVIAAGVFSRVANAPGDEFMAYLISEVKAIADGRSLHRRLAIDSDRARPPIDELAETLNAMISRLEQSFAGLRRFTADASHELKTPLAVLRADVERALAADSNRGEQLIALEEALAETTRMADLVDSLLTLARADEGRFDLVREPVDLQAMTRDVLETAHLLAEPKGITVRMATAPALTVPGDGARLRQLFLNLITNAIKYTPQNGEVELSLERVGATAQFSVRDTGIGIAAADLPHVFDRFWRADRARSRVGDRGGFGLGLAISQYIAQAHGGSLIAHSRLGRGSTFTVALPLIDGVAKMKTE